eukprot:CAMPEP_0195027836 /NCGR_PEP_ID=MMETSP0326_2-20130528/53117_1 /TAXON_ID=2866 ORGANISM="Crypthecodinium cohnii, Strain Seligo" /NCGR_SAMPLE_ID=MMETSP0326_2 /ASSEMBLY_ACC=CAM_ASM_000348 /LENGTH=30 /DNA_ID= /DNA_START= /DNA_END= /DNA_ORIENTATION=
MTYSPQSAPMNPLAILGWTGVEGPIAIGGG